MWQQSRHLSKYYNRTHIHAFTVDEKQGIKSIISGEQLSEECVATGSWFRLLGIMMKLSPEEFIIPDAFGYRHHLCPIKPEMCISILWFGLAKSQICDNCSNPDLNFGDCTLVQYWHRNTDSEKRLSLCKTCAQLANDMEDRVINLVAAIDYKTGEIIVCSTFNGEYYAPIVQHIPKK